MADALDVAARYAKRWKIEDLFRTMKRKGFDIESLRISDAGPRNRLVLACFIACFIAATVVMQMTAEREGPGLRPLTEAFDPEDTSLLEALCRDLEGKTDRQKNPHPPTPSRQPRLRHMGLRKARRMDRLLRQTRPVILRGWTEFQTLKHGATLGQNLVQCPEKDV